jgi:hypothetical protein
VTSQSDAETAQRDAGEQTHGNDQRTTTAHAQPVGQHCPDGEHQEQRQRQRRTATSLPRGSRRRSRLSAS